MRILKSCRLIFYSVLFLLVGFNAAALNAEDDKQSQRDLKKVLSLEKKFWRRVQKKKFNQLKNLMSSSYQKLGPSGVAMNKQKQIDELKESDLLGFGFNRPKVTRKGGTLTFSYDLIAIGDRIESGPQIVVWKIIKSKCNKSKWKLISRSNQLFIPPTNNLL